jgi:hypothetical protein
MDEAKKPSHAPVRLRVGEKHIYFKIPIFGIAMSNKVIALSSSP